MLTLAVMRIRALESRLGAGPALREWYKVALYFPYITYLALSRYPAFLRKLQDCNMAASLVLSIKINTRVGVQWL